MAKKKKPAKSPEKAAPKKVAPKKAAPKSKGVRAQRSAPKSVGQQMAAAAADAVRLTDTYFTEELDFTEESVSTIERLIDDIHYSMPNGKTQANIDLLCRVWGAYIGEVFRKHVGGEWIEWEDEYGKAIAFQSGEVKVFPMDKVRKRIVGGPEHNLRGYYGAFRDQMSASK